MRLRIGPVLAVAALVVSACTSSGGGRKSGVFEARPMILPGQHTVAVRADPFGSIRVPQDEVAYSRMSRAQQVAIRNALGAVDCAHPPKLAGTSVRVVCDDESFVYLLGAPLFTAKDVKKAVAIRPLSPSAQWSVGLTLDSSGADKMYQWTSRYHVPSPVGAFNSAETTAKPPCLQFSTTKCSDFVAYVSGNVVVTVPVTLAPLNSAVSVQGDFTERAATRLAHNITG